MGTGIPLENYMRGASILEYGLPVTVLLLAVPLYRQRAALKAHKLAFLAGITAGVLTCMISTVGLCYLFGLDEILLRSCFPAPSPRPWACWPQKSWEESRGSPWWPSSSMGFRGF